MTEEPTLSEYKDVSDNIRQYSTMRFAQMTLFFGITGVLLASIANSQFQQSSFQLYPPSPLPSFSSASLLGFAGIISFVVFWLMEERVNDYWHHFIQRAIELEKQLGYTQYSKRPKKGILTATNAVRILYAALGVFWIWFVRFPDWASWLLTALVCLYLGYKVFKHRHP